jgi:Tfp pilus assembly protein PilN
MTERLGLEITPAVLRGAWGSTWRTHPVRTFEVAWDGQDLAGAVAALRQAHPTPEAIALAVGLGFLEVARVELPPAPDDAREQMLALDPERFLGANSTLQVVLAPGSDVAIGCDQRWLQQAVRTLEGWAPVERVEAAPVALAASGCPDGTWQLEAGTGEPGSIQVVAGRIAALRRGSQAADAKPLPAYGEHAGTMRAAWGALRRTEAPATATLMDRGARQAANRRRWQGLAMAALGAAAASLFLVAAIDRSRERTRDALEAEAARLTTEAGPALAAQSARLAAVREHDVARSTLASRVDPAAALAAFSALLPRDVVVTAARMTGPDWQVEGTARNAAALVPLLDADPRFDNVRSLAASSRFRDGRETRESFSIAFRVGTPE